MTMSFVVKQTTLPVISKTLGQAASITRFPVNRVYCIGRNYREHALEMGHDPGEIYWNQVDCSGISLDFIVR